MCLGSDARLLVLTARRNDVQGALMLNSTKQLRLTAQAEELSAERTAALSNAENCIWEYRGSQEFDYNTLMNDGYFIVASDTKKMVLNNRYAEAMRAAGIKEEGGNYSVAGLNKFMNALGLSPKSPEAKNWAEVDSGKVMTTSEITEAELQALYIKEYGEDPGEGQVLVSPAQYKWNENKIKPSSIPSDIDLYTKTYDVIKESITEGLNNLANAFKNVSTSSVYTEALNNAKTKISNELFDGYEDENGEHVNGALEDACTKDHWGYENYGDNGYFGNENSSRRPLIYKSNTPVGWDPPYGISSLPPEAQGGIYETHAAIHVVPSGNDTTNPKYDVSVNMKRFADIMKYEIVAALGDASAQANENDESLMSLMIKTKDAVMEDVENDKGYTHQELVEGYEEWKEEYLATHNTSSETEKAISINEEDKATLAKYKRIFERACQGWQEDGDLSKSYVTNKLVNNQFMLEKDGKLNTIKDFSDFSQRNVKDEKNTKAIEAYYDGEELKIKNQEKRLGLEQSSLQTELSAIETETQSVQSILDKNIERSFNIFG